MFILAERLGCLSQFEQINRTISHIKNESGLYIYHTIDI